MMNFITPTRFPTPGVDSRLRDVDRGEDGYSARYKHLAFVVSEGMEMDGKWWLHGSVSRWDRTMPTYEDLMLLKKLCIGENRTAIQVFSSTEKHIDYAGKRPNPIQVLHLWSTEENILPDFARGGNII